MNAQPLDRYRLGFIILNQLLTHKCDLAQLKKKKKNIGGNNMALKHIKIPRGAQMY